MQTQLCLHDANLKSERLTSMLKESDRAQEDGQYSKPTTHLEYVKQVHASPNCVVHTPILTSLIHTEADETFPTTNTCKCVSVLSG